MDRREGENMPDCPLKNLHPSMETMLCRRMTDMEADITRMNVSVARLLEENARYKAALESAKPENPENGELR